MLSVRLSVEQESALQQLSEETGRSKSYYVKQALDEFLEDRADYLVALAAIERAERRYNSVDVRRKLGL
ncbi:MAG: DUF6290 family protein [Rhodoglobus sp.]